MGSTLQKPAAGAGETSPQQQMRYIPDPSVNHALPGNWQGFGGMRQMLPSPEGGPQLFTDPPGGLNSLVSKLDPSILAWLQQMRPPQQAPAPPPQAPLGAPVYDPGHNQINA